VYIYNTRLLNHHQAVTLLILWDNSVPKHILQMLNHLGISSSHTFQLRAVTAISKDAVQVARTIARDPEKIKLLEYNNFNWMSCAWEVSATHGNVQHDQVSSAGVIFARVSGVTFGLSVFPFTFLLRCSPSRSPLRKPSISPMVFTSIPASKTSALLQGQSW
jgi:hypothetical protein